MSKDVIRPLISAVADLPFYYTGLVLGVVKALSGPPRNASVVAERLGMAISTPVTSEVQSSLLVMRTVTVDRGRDPLEVLRIRGRECSLNKMVVNEMPSSEKGVVHLIFYRIGQDVFNSRIDDELAKVGLELDPNADPVALAQVSVDDPAFSDTYPYGKPWKNKEDQWCYVIFHKWEGKRLVSVRKDNFDGSDNEWRAGTWFPVRSISTLG